jgi:hypothetical protein
MRPRITVRRAMLAVAFVALGCFGARWAVVMRERSRAYAALARLCDYKSKVAARASLPGSYDAEWSEEWRAIADWYAARRDLYDDAAARPWRVVPPAAEPVFGAKP